MAEPTNGSGSCGLLWTEWAAVVVAAIALVGLSLGMAVAFSPFRTVAIVLALLLVTAIVMRRLRAPRTAADPRPSAFSGAGARRELLPVTLLLGFGAWHAVYSGAEIFIRRDPASYANTAAWLIRHGGLEKVVDWSRFGLAGDIPFAASTAVYAVAENTHQFQFVHGASVLMATAGGMRPALLFLVTAVVAALALALAFQVMRALGAAAWAALLATVLLGMSVPFAYVARSTYSEPYVAAVVLAAVAVGMRAFDRRSEPLLALAAALAGSAMLFRVDGWLYVAGFFVAVAVGMLASDWRPNALPSVLAAGMPVAVGALDLVRFTGFYGEHLADRWRLLAALSAASALVFLVVRSVPVIQVLADRSRVVPARVARALAAGGALIAASIIGVGFRDPLATLRFWYGPALLVLAGIGAYRLLVEVLEAPWSGRTFAGVFLAFGIPLYVVRPSIFPDQPWASRRLSAFVLFALFILVALGLTYLLDETRQRSAALTAVASVTALALVAGLAQHVLTDTRHVRSASPGSGQVEVVGAIAEIAGERPVIVLGLPHIAMPLSAFGGLDVASYPSEVASDAAQQLIASLRESGHTPIVVLPDVPRGRESASAVSRLGDSACVTSVRALVGPQVAGIHAADGSSRLVMRGEAILVVDPDAGAC